MKTMNENTLNSLIEQSYSEMNFDVDVDFCLENDIKFKNHEVDASEVELFDSASNKAAFNFVFNA